MFFATPSTVKSLSKMMECVKRFEKKMGLTNEFVVTCVGQIQPRKGIYDFIETAEKCPNVTFVWVGGTPFKGLTAEYNKLQEVVKQAQKNIIFTGIVDFNEMPGYYAASDVFYAVLSRKFCIRYH